MSSPLKDLEAALARIVATPPRPQDAAPEVTRAVGSVAPPHANRRVHTFTTARHGGLQVIVIGTKHPGYIAKVRKVASEAFSARVKELAREALR